MAESAASRTPGHREVFDRELLQLKESVFRMGALVENAIDAAVGALGSRDPIEAEAVLSGDRAINEAQREVADLVAATIATQSPVARDLRFLLALNRVAYELERIGDHAAGVAHQARELAPVRLGSGSPTLAGMGGLAAELLHAILRALVDLDEPAARAIAARDDELDAQYHAFFEKVMDRMHDDAGWVDVGARLLFAAHDLERVGDRVTNIAEDVVFLATGEVEDLNP